MKALALAPRGSTSNAPVPLISRPVCRTWHLAGGSQTVISIVSRNPIRPTPVNASIAPPTPWPSRRVGRTVVPSIQAP